MHALLVEDEALLRMMLCGSLSDFGFEVEQAETADAAWKMVEEGLDFDLLVTDVRMPGKMDGIELAERVKAKVRDAAIVIMSGFAGSNRTSTENFPNFLPKPFTEARLLTLIKQAMAN
jgi:two-component system, response regulator PdtaR